MHACLCFRYKLAASHSFVFDSCCCQFVISVCRLFSLPLLTYYRKLIVSLCKYHLFQNHCLRFYHFCAKNHHQLLKLKDKLWFDHCMGWFQGKIYLLLNQFHRCQTVVAVGYCKWTTTTTKTTNEQNHWVIWISVELTMCYFDDYGRDIWFDVTSIWLIELLVSRLTFLRPQACKLHSLVYVLNGFLCSWHRYSMHPESRET